MSSAPDNQDTANLGFTFRMRKNGDVEILHQGRLASTLRGVAAVEFVSEVENQNTMESQQLMARLTGNFKRGNERQPGEHPRNRR